MAANHSNSLETLQSIYGSRKKSKKRSTAPKRATSARSRKENIYHSTRPSSARPRLESGRKASEKKKDKERSLSRSRSTVSIVPPPRSVNVKKSTTNLKAPMDRLREICSLERSLKAEDLVDIKVEKVAITKLIYGEYNVHVMEALNELSHAYIEVGDFEMSLVHSKKALKMSHFVPQTEEVAGLVPKILSTISMPFYKLEQPGKAKSLLYEALQANIAIHGKEHVSNFSILLGLAKVCNKIKRLEDALALLEKAWKIRKRSDENHPDLVAVYLEWAKVLVAQEQTEAAIEMYERARKLICHHQGERSTDMAHISYVLVDLYTAQAEYEKALEYATLSYEILCQSRMGRKAAGVPLQIHVQITLGFVLVKCHQFNKAAKMLECSLDQIAQFEAQGKEIPLSRVQKANTLKMLGTVLLRIEQVDRAANTYRQAVKIYAREYGLQDDRTQQLIRRIAELEDYNDKESNETNDIIDTDDDSFGESL